MLSTVDAAQARYNRERAEMNRAAQATQDMRAQVERAVQSAVLRRDAEVASYLRSKGINATAR